MKREKQIEEMAECLIDIQQNFNEYCAKPCRECELGGIVNCENHYKAEALYNAGYRKQSVGEWKLQEGYNRLVMCTACGYEYTDLVECTNFCGNCGAKMKGGAE